MAIKKTWEKQSMKKTETANKPANPEMESRKKANLIAAAIILLGTLFFVVLANNLPYTPYSTGMTGASVNYEIARVVAVTDESLQDSGHQKGLMVGSQTLQVKILTGAHKGETVAASNALSTYNSVVGKPGGHLIVNVDELDSGEFQVRVYNYFRAPFIYLLALLFFASLILVGGKKGLMSGLGILYTFFCVFLVFLPLVLRGHSPVLASILLVVMVSAVALVLLNGVSKKSLCSILGTVCGVVLSGVILFLFSSATNLSGYSTEEAESLLQIGQTTGLKVRDLLYAGILIASLGAIMDTAMSIVSVMHEMYLNSPGMKMPSLIKAGMNVGKDMIGTMSNTLILAFAGTSLSFIILLASYSVQYNQFMNMNTITIEIAQALSGSLAIVLTVPITAVITARMFIKK
jgi:uncharacterized membrane protein